ncbi:MAG: hypothetical protein IKI72_03940 [Bacteroidales bacterium]|nr:hypothetical protein [Bacteroidales bacterium]
MPHDYERDHRANQQKYERAVGRIYRDTAKRAAALPLPDSLPEGALFSFATASPAVKRLARRLFRQMARQVELVVVNGVRSEWTLANNKCDELARRVFGDLAMRLSPAEQRRYFSTNATARDAFLARKVNGMSLSDRVWRYTDQYREEIELGLDVGIRTGMPADEIGRELQQYLQYPGKLFRRVRDIHGNLQLSKAAAAFHPGRGVYRSSYKNARRLAGTETNIAYRTADYERWQQMDFVVGIEIHLSNNHTVENAKGERVPLEDICDELAGRYPKDFKFTGWHPNCRCYATSILKTPEEMSRDRQRIMRGEAPLPDSVNTVRDVPKGFKEWIANNERRVKYYSSVPYFLKDNPRYVPDDFVRNIGSLVRDHDAGVISDLKEFFLKVKDPTYITEKEVKSMITDFARVYPSMFYGGLRSVSIIKADRGFMMANARSYFRGNHQYDVKSGNRIKIADHDFNVGGGLLFNPLYEIKSAMKAIAEKRKLTFNEEYALESLWHEIRHAAARGWEQSDHKTPDLSMVMETVNQFCARRSYGQFVRAVGGKPSNLKSVIENGYGYRRWVRNFEQILRHCNISASSAHGYFRDRIISTPYEEIKEEVTEFLIKRGGLKRAAAEQLLTGLRLPPSIFDKLLTGA